MHCHATADAAADAEADATADAATHAPPHGPADATTHGPAGADATAADAVAQVHLPQAEARMRSQHAGRADAGGLQQGMHGANDPPPTLAAADAATHADADAAAEAATHAAANSAADVATDTGADSGTASRADATSGSNSGAAADTAGAANSATGAHPPTSRDARSPLAAPNAACTGCARWRRDD